MKNYKKRLRIGKVMLSSILLMVIFFGCVDMTMLSAQAAKRTVAKAKTSLIYLNNPYSDIILKENGKKLKYGEDVLRLGSELVEWQYSTDLKFKRDVHSLKGWLNEESEFYGLSRGKTYYVCARMLSYVDNGDRINGEWSVTRKVKVK